MGFSASKRQSIRRRLQLNLAQNVHITRLWLVTASAGDPGHPEDALRSHVVL